MTVSPLTNSSISTSKGVASRWDAFFIRYSSLKKHFISSHPLRKLIQIAETFPFDFLSDSNVNKVLVDCTNSSSEMNVLHLCRALRKPLHKLICCFPFLLAKVIGESNSANAVINWVCVSLQSLTKFGGKLINNENATPILGRGVASRAHYSLFPLGG